MRARCSDSPADARLKQCSWEGVPWNIGGWSPSLGVACMPSVPECCAVAPGHAGLTCTLCRGSGVPATRPAPSLPPMAHAFEAGPPRRAVSQRRNIACKMAWLCPVFQAVHMHVCCAKRCSRDVPRMPCQVDAALIMASMPRSPHPPAALCSPPCTEAPGPFGPGSAPLGGALLCTWPPRAAGPRRWQHRGAVKHRRASGHL